jgi:hypothetical protein
LKHHLIDQRDFKHRTDIGAEYFEAGDHQLFRRTVCSFLQDNDVDANMSSSVPAHLLPSTSAAAPDSSADPPPDTDVAAKEFVVAHKASLSGSKVPSMRLVQMFSLWIASHHPTFVVRHNDFLKAIKSIYNVTVLVDADPVYCFPVFTSIPCTTPEPERNLTAEFYNQCIVRTNDCNDRIQLRQVYLEYQLFCRDQGLSFLKQKFFKQELVAMIGSPQHYKETSNFWKGYKLVSLRAL